MWLFTRKPKPKPGQSVPRHISIRTRDDQGESGEARFVYDSLQNQGQGSSFRTAFPVKESADTLSEEDDNETASTSSSTSVSNRRSLQISGPSRNFGSYPREPLDPTVWSNVTSPGFTTRMVQQAHNNSMDRVGGGSPLKEIMSNRSPFSRSPNGHLRVGQLPVEAVPRRPGILNFPSPTKRRSILTFGRYSRVAKRDAKYGTVFVKLAPIHSKGTAPPVTPSKPSPSLGTPGVNYNESAGGLGGIPQSPCGLSQRLSRLWPNKSPRQSSASTNSSQPTSGPNTILEALANRKRGRDVELSPYDSSIRQSSGSKAFTSPDEISKYSKRVKFVNEQDMRLYSPLMFNTYEDINSCGAEPLTSKSILEQMNQTEKRFLPDSALETSHSKRHKSIGSPRGTSTPILRKRRSDSRINLLETDDDATFDDHKTKNVKLCDCNQCYEEAAGSPTLQESPVKSSESPTGILKKTVTFDDALLDRSNRHPTSWADQGTETDLVTGPPEVNVRKSIRTSGYITMEKYEFDRNMRMERFRRILGLNKASPEANQGSDVLDSTSSNPSTSNAFSFGGSQTKLNPDVGGFSFGQPQSSPQVAANSGQPQSTAQVAANSGQPQSTAQVAANSGQPQSTAQVAANSGKPQSTAQAAASSGQPQSTAQAAANSGQPQSSPQVVADSGKPQSTAQAAASSGQLQSTAQAAANSGQPQSSPQVVADSGKPQSSPQVTASSGQPLNEFGQQQTPQGGFNFGTQASPSFGDAQSSPANNMFTLGTSASAASPRGGLNFTSKATASGIGNLPANQNAFSTQQNLSSSTANPSSGVLDSASPNPSTSNAFSFGSSQTQLNPNSEGFSFGQTQSSPLVAANSGPPQSSPPVAANTGQPQSSPPVASNSGQPQSSPPVAANSGQPQSSLPVTTNSGQPLTEFGQQQTPQGGFNFGTQASPSFGDAQSSPANNMFTLGTSASAASPRGGLNFTSKPTASGIGNLPANQNAFSTQQNLSSSTANPSSGVFDSASSNPSTSNTFSFGGSQTQLNPNSGGFSFGQPQSSPQVAANSGQPLNKFGQSQILPGGFNFGTQASPSFGDAQSSPANNMFTLGTSASAASPRGGFNFTSQATASGMGNLPVNQNAFSTQQNLSSSTANPSSGVFDSASSNPSTSNAFSFGGSQTQLNPNSGGFSFGQPRSSPQVAANSGQPLNQFGQQQTPQGGFNFASQATASGMGNLPANQNAFSTQQNLSSSAANPSSGVFDSASSNPSTSNAFSFGGSQTQLNPNSGGFSFGQPQSSPQVAANSGQPLNQFGQQQTPQGGFNFTSQATASGMGNLPANQNTFSTQQNLSSSTANPSSGVFGSLSSNPPTSTAFNFGGSQTQLNPNAGGFSFGQPQSSPQVAANSGQPLNQFGQSQTLPGGFNFGTQASPSFGDSQNTPANNMFTLGTSASAPRRRGMRRYR